MWIFFETMMIFIANSETIHPNGEKSKVSPRRPLVGRKGTFRPPVGRRGTFRPTVGQKGLFGQQLAKDALFGQHLLYCFRKFISIRIFSILI